MSVCHSTARQSGQRRVSLPGSRLCRESLTGAMIALNREGMSKGFVQRADRQQTTLLPEVTLMIGWLKSNPVRAVDM